MTNWLDVAHEVAATLRSDAADRDRANQPPTKEVELLRQSGLLNVKDWAVQQKVTRIVGALTGLQGHTPAITCHRSPAYRRTYSAIVACWTCH